MHQALGAGIWYGMSREHLLQALAQTKDGMWKMLVEKWPLPVFLTIADNYSGSTEKETTGQLPQESF